MPSAAYMHMAKGAGMIGKRTAGIWFKVLLREITYIMVKSTAT
jgi:hypothetical protein